MDNTTDDSGVTPEAAADWLLRALALSGFVLAVAVFCCRRRATSIAACWGKLLGKSVSPTKVVELADIAAEALDRAGTPMSGLAAAVAAPTSPAIRKPAVTRHRRAASTLPQFDEEDEPVVEPTPIPQRPQKPRPPPPPPPPRSSTVDNTPPVLQNLSVHSFLNLVQAEPPLTGRSKPPEKDRARWSRGSLRLPSPEP